VIRQAISCDVCGAEKKQTNHWYVACEVADELRLSGWNSRMRQRAGTKHLCGQTCLHKLVDEFIVRTSESRASAPLAGATKDSTTRSDTDTSLTSPSAYVENPASAQRVPLAVLEVPAANLAPRMALAIPNVPSMQTCPAADAHVAVGRQAEDAPGYSSRRWRAEAWERERNRELRAVERHPDIARRRKGI
jgi:hypothetical protein